MCFVTGSDELESIDVVIFPEMYKKYNDIKIGDIIRVKGRVEKRFDKYQITANEIEKIDL